MSKAKYISKLVDASGSTTSANVSYTGTLTGSTGVITIGTNQLYKDASGNVGIGTSSPSSYGKLAIVTTDSFPAIDIRSDGRTYVTSSSYANFVLHNRSAIYAARGTNATPLTLSGGDYIYDQTFYGYDGTSFLGTAAISAITGTISAGSVPTSLVFGTGTSTQSERMRIDSSGNVGIGTSSLISGNPGSGSLTAAGVLSASGYLTTHQTNKAVIQLYNNIMGFRSYGATTGTGQIAFNVGGGGGNNDAEAMRIDSSGNVGIGTSSPTAGYKLDVVGAIKSTSAPVFFTQGSANITGNNGLVLGTLAKNVSPSGGSGAIQIFSNDATNQLQASMSLITDATSNTNYRLTFQCIEQGIAYRNITLCESGGNVGIGTSSPAQKLHIASDGYNFRTSNGANSFGYNLGRNTGDGLLYFYGDQSGNTGYVFSGINGERMRLNSVGNLGIGTTNPTEKLHVMGSTIFDFVHGQNIKLGVSAGNNGNTTYSGDAYLYLWTSEPDSTWTGAGIGRNIVNTANFPRVNTNLSGQMIRFDEGDSASISLITETKAGTRYTPLYVTNGTVYMPSGNVVVTSNLDFVGGAATVRIHMPGGTVSSSNSGIAAAWNVHSDYRLKENVTTITNALTLVGQLNPVFFTWKNEENIPTAGFIAHELAQQAPYAVLGEKDAVNEDGSISAQSADYSKVVPLLVASIKEQQTIIEALTTRLTALESLIK